MSDHEAHWDIYFGRVEDVPTSFSLDLALIHSAPDQSRPLLVRVLIGALTHRDNGMPSSEDFEVLYELEDRIVAVLSARSCIHVGAVSSPVGRQVIGYAPDDANLSRADFAFVPPERQPVDFFTIDRDEDWTYYRDFMYPDDATLRYMADCQVLRNLHNAGDDASIERRVDHWIYFESCATRDRFSDWARSAGYGAEIWETSSDDQRPCVRIHHIINLLDNTIHPAIAAIVAQAESMEGEYDGWETSAVQRTKDREES